MSIELDDLEQKYSTTSSSYLSFIRKYDLTARCSTSGETRCKISLPKIRYCPPTLLALIKPFLRRRLIVLLLIFSNSLVSAVVYTSLGLISLFI